MDSTEYRFNIYGDNQKFTFDIPDTEYYKITIKLTTNDPNRRIISTKNFDINKGVALTEGSSYLDFEYQRNCPDYNNENICELIKYDAINSDTAVDITNKYNKSVDVNMYITPRSRFV